MGVTSGWFTRTRRIGAVAMGVLVTLVACRDDVTPGRVTGLDERAGLVSNAPNQQDWRHCENDKDPASACNWTTGNLTQTHNLYYEGWYVPHALRIPHIVGTAPDTLVMTFGFKKGGHHTFDFLGRWNASLPNANVCTESSYSEFCTGPVSATSPPAMRPISASTPPPPAGRRGGTVSRRSSRARRTAGRPSPCRASTWRRSASRARRSTSATRMRR